MTAVEGGRSVDTSMGFTPFEGLMMATRSGSIDPGIMLHLMGEGIPAPSWPMDWLTRSGLLAVAGSDSAREIEARAEASDARASLALDIVAAGPPAVLVIAAREDLVIAAEAASLVDDKGTPGR